MVLTTLVGDTAGSDEGFTMKGAGGYNGGLDVRGSAVVRTIKLG